MSLSTTVSDFHPALYLVWDREAGEYVAAPVSACVARWATSGMRCGEEGWRQIGDAWFCSHHYTRAETWVIEHARQELQEIDRERDRLDGRRKRLDAEIDRREKRRREVKQEQRREASIVYFVRRESDGLIKIGTTSDIGQRMATLRREHGELQLLHALSGDRTTETALHAQFAVWRERGEWFHPGRDLMRWIGVERRGPGRLRVSGMVSAGTLDEVSKGALRVPPPGQYIPPSRTRYEVKG